jgi:hypothetical protein
MKLIDGGRPDNKVVELQGIRRQREEESRDLLEAFMHQLAELSSAINRASRQLGYEVIPVSEADNDNDNDNDGYHEA